MKHRIIFLILFCALLSSIAPNISAQAAPLSQQETQTPNQANRIFLPLVAGQQPQSSDILIEAALQRGEINAETALIYHTFAAFNDPRLPSAYRGDGTVQNEIASTLVSQYDSLSEDAKETLAPFILPPYHSGSWWDERFGEPQARVAANKAVKRCGNTGTAEFPPSLKWHYVNSPKNNVRVWWQDRYPEDAAKAKEWAETADEIWDSLKTLMKRTPPSDQGTTTRCRGGSNHLDISLVDMADEGEAYAYLANKASASYILLNRKTNESTLIHELMHSFQYSFDLAGNYEEYSWWNEATADWAMHYVRPDVNEEHKTQGQVFNKPELELESDAEQHEYGANLFPLYLQLTTGSGDLVRQSYVQFGSNKNSLVAINKVIPGGFKETWPKFVMQLLNRDPVDKFQKGDQISRQVKFRYDIEAKLLGLNDFSYELDGEVNHLASHPFRIKFVDDTIRSVAFINPLMEQPQETAKIQALVKIDGKWQEEDWTALPARTFCRDVSNERVEELMIVISNHEWQDRNHKLSMTPFVNVSNVACRGWDFEITATETMSSSYRNYTEVSKTTGRWERNMEDTDPLDGRPFEHYQAKDIKATWEHKGTNGLCVASDSGSVTLPGAEQTWLAVWNNALDPSGRTYAAERRVYNGFGSDVVVWQTNTIEYKCPDAPSQFMHLNTLAHWFATEVAPTQSVSEDGTEIRGSFSKTETGIDHQRISTYTWTMTALPPE